MINVIEKDLQILSEQQRSLNVLMTDIYEQLQMDMPPQQDVVNTPTPAGSQRLASIVDTINSLGSIMDYNIAMARVLREVIGYSEPPNMASDVAGVSPYGRSQVGYGPGTQKGEVAL